MVQPPQMPTPRLYGSLRASSLHPIATGSRHTFVSTYIEVYKPTNPPKSRRERLLMSTNPSKVTSVAAVKYLYQSFCH
jgi:hypothetical protein